MSNIFGAILSAMVLCAPFVLAGIYAITKAQIAQNKHIDLFERHPWLAKITPRHLIYDPQQVKGIQLIGVLCLCIGVFTFFIVMAENLR